MRRLGPQRIERHLAEAVENRFTDFNVDPESVLQVLKGYEKKKRTLGAMDFDDLLVNCLRYSGSSSKSSAGTSSSSCTSWSTNIKI